MVMVILWLLISSLATTAAVVGFCNDRDPNCARWGFQGECNGKNAQHLRALCPHTCGTCSHLCEDQDSQCGAWALGGECKKTPDFMLKTCPTSCGLCAPQCSDIHADCNHWVREGHCQSNPTFMSYNCPVACGICQGACKDLDDNCPNWAEIGECVKNPAHTLQACSYSCKCCHPSLVCLCLPECAACLPDVNFCQLPQATWLVPMGSPAWTLTLRRAPYGSSAASAFATQSTCSLLALRHAACAPPSAKTRTQTASYGQRRVNAMRTPWR